MPRNLHTLTLLTTCCVIGHGAAQSLTVEAAANTTNQNNQGTSSQGTLTLKKAISPSDNTVAASTSSAETITFEITELDLDGDGKTNDHIIVDFKLTASGPIYTSKSTGTGWLSADDSNFRKDGQSLNISHIKTRYFMNGHPSPIRIKFGGFSSLTMGSWDIAGAPHNKDLDRATINNKQYTAKATNETLQLRTHPTKLNVAFNQTNGDSGIWRIKGFGFKINLPPHTHTIAHHSRKSTTTSAQKSPAERGSLLSIGNLSIMIGDRK
ncbi:hypothetical protein [Rubritalea tangerina]|uniref:Uncharacterized protein n=1 Tax=Rubritalea tangerina TaxID=430798 RepID=A0ABW4ZA44_9BACT